MLVGVEEFLGQERLGLLGLAWTVSRIRSSELSSCFCWRSSPSRTCWRPVGVAERVRWAAGGLLGFELVGELGLVLVELGGPGRASRSRSSAKRSDDFLRRSSRTWSIFLLLGPGPFGHGLREPASFEGLGRLADVLAGLLDLLALLGHPLAVLLALHPLLKLVGVAEDLLLLLAEPLELAVELLAGLLVLGGFERRLEFLEPGVEVGLALGQLLEPVGDLAVLSAAAAAAGSGPGASVLLLEAVLVVLQLELVELLLPLLLRALAGLLLLTSRFWRVTSNSRARSLSRA